MYFYLWSRTLYMREIQFLMLSPQIIVLTLQFYLGVWQYSPDIYIAFTYIQTNILFTKQIQLPFGVLSEFILDFTYLWQFGL